MKPVDHVITSPFHVHARVDAFHDIFFDARCKKRTWRVFRWRDAKRCVQTDAQRRDVAAELMPAMRALSANARQKSVITHASAAKNRIEAQHRKNPPVDTHHHTFDPNPD